MAILIALIPMITWGSIGLVSGKLGGDANQQTLGMTIGAFLFSVATFLYLRPAIDLRILVLGVIIGLVWSIGQNGQFHAMKYLGVSMGLPVSTGAQLALNMVAGAVLFHEWTTTKDVTLGLMALVLLVSGVVLTAKQDKKNGAAASNALFNYTKGLQVAAISTLGYGAYTIISTWANVDTYALILPQSIGMLIGASLFAFKKTKVDKFVGRNILTGLLWAVGNLCMLLTVKSLGLAVGFSLSQMGIIISTLGGIFLLGEKKSKKELVYVISGCLLVILGGILLGYMKA